MKRVFNRRHRALAVLTGFVLAAGANAHAGTSGNGATTVPGLGVTVFGAPAATAGAGCNPLAPVTNVVNKVIEALATPPANPVMPINPLGTLHTVIGAVTQVLGEAGGLLGQSGNASARVAGLTKPAGQGGGIVTLVPETAGGAVQTITVLGGGAGAPANAGSGPLAPAAALMSALVRGLPK